MKKLGLLKLNKEVIAKFNDEQLSNIKGGTGTTSTVCANPGTVTIAGNTCICITYDTPYNHCDFPTINDSCFSWCKYICNDF